MKEITFLNTKIKGKKSFFAPFISEIAKWIENIRVKGAEKQAVSCHNGPEKRVVSLRKQAWDIGSQTP